MRVDIPSCPVIRDDLWGVLGRLLYFVSDTLTVNSVHDKRLDTKRNEVIFNLAVKDQFYTMRLEYTKACVRMQFTAVNSLNTKELELALFRALNSMGLDRLTPSQYRRYVPYCEAPLLPFDVRSAYATLALRTSIDTRVPNLFPCELFTAPQPTLAAYADDINPAHRVRCLAAGVMVRHSSYRSPLEIALVESLR